MFWGSRWAPFAVAALALLVPGCLGLYKTHAPASDQDVGDPATPASSDNLPPGCHPNVFSVAAAALGGAQAGSQGTPNYAQQELDEHCREALEARRINEENALEARHMRLEAAELKQREAASGTAQPKPTAAPATERIAREALAATVLVKTRTHIGSGFIVPGGRIVTSLHVVAGANAVVVKTSSGAEHVVQGVRAFDRTEDLAVLDAGIKAPGLALANGLDEAPGSPVVIVGNPEGLEGTVSTGVISGKRMTRSGTVLLQVDAPISPGSSGGPVLDRNGRVIGVVEMFFTHGQNLNFAVPGRYVERLLASSNPMSMTAFASATAPQQAAKPAQAPAAATAQRAQPNFPASVAGFPFGITVARASQLCGGKLVGTVKTAWCPFLPVGVPFATDYTACKHPNLCAVELDFDAGILTAVVIDATSWSAAWSALVDKYGPPNAATLKVKGRWFRFVRRNGQWTHKPIHDIKLRKRGAVWSLAGGDIVVMPGLKTEIVGYESARHQGIQRHNY